MRTNVDISIKKKTAAESLLRHWIPLIENCTEKSFHCFFFSLESIRKKDKNIKECLCCSLFFLMDIHASI